MKKKLVKFFKANPHTAFKNKEIAKRLKVETPEDYALLKSIIHNLFEEEFLFKKGKRYQLNQFPESNKITGVLQLHPDGYGFVIPRNKKLEDVFIAERNISTAFDGDTVEVVLFAKQKRKRLEGQIINILERKKSEVTGTLQKSKSFYFIHPDNFYMQRDVYIDKSNLADAKVGDKVVVGNIEWKTSMLNPEGSVLSVLGKEGTIDADKSSIAKQFNLPLTFNRKVNDEAEKTKLEISDEELSKRLDFREENVFTIDPVDAKDFDDALSVKKLHNGNLKIGVHIADVSHYVQKDSALDKQAELRGNSVYLVGAVIPMLPEKLSNGICSLVPDEDRLTFSVIFEMKETGEVINYKISKSVIKSKRRFTYEEVQEIIEKGKGEFADEITLLNMIAQNLRKTRIEEGSIEFFTPEIVFELDEKSKPIAVKRKEIKNSNMLVEEFMLLANKTVAQHFAAPKKSGRKKIIYRVHDKPEDEKIQEFTRFVKSLGYQFKSGSFSNSREIQKLIEQVKGSEEESVVNELAIRSMAKAVYATKNIGHFGLGFKYYTHFTSPIRRYSDLLVHRLIFSYINKQKSGTYYTVDQLSKICDHISKCERNAIEAERLSVKMKQAIFLKDKIGEEFHAVISGVAHFGIFVELTDILAEGLIRVKDLEGDFYVYDEKKYSLIGRRTKKRYRLGDKLLVKLIRVDLEKLELDFITLEESGKNNV